MTQLAYLPIIKMVCNFLHISEISVPINLVLCSCFSMLLLPGIARCVSGMLTSNYFQRTKKQGKVQKVRQAERKSHQGCNFLGDYFTLKLV